MQHLGQPQYTPYPAPPHPVDPSGAAASSGQQPPSLPLPHAQQPHAQPNQPQQNPVWGLDAPAWLQHPGAPPPGLAQQGHSPNLSQAEGSPGLPSGLFQHLLQQPQHPAAQQQQLYGQPGQQQPNPLAQYGIPSPYGHPHPAHLAAYGQQLQQQAQQQQQQAQSQQQQQQQPAAIQVKNEEPVKKEDNNNEEDAADAEGEDDPTAATSIGVPGANGEYTPSDPYINALRASSSSRSPSANGIPAEQKFATFPATLPGGVGNFNNTASNAGTPQPEGGDVEVGNGGEDGSSTPNRGRASRRKGSPGPNIATTPSGFAVPRPPGAHPGSYEASLSAATSRDASVDSSYSASTSTNLNGGGSSNLNVGVAAGRNKRSIAAAMPPDEDSTDAGTEDGDPPSHSGGRLPGPGFAAPRARRQTEIPAVEDDPSVRPYGCNYCSPASGIPSAMAVTVSGGGAGSGQTSWRTIKELREHHTSVHKERQRELEEQGDEQALMEMPFRCALDPCGKTFKSLAGLRFHFQNASANGHFFVSVERDEDTGEERPTKKFKQEVKPSGRELGCPVGRCPKKFKQSAGLAYHLSHTNNHPITLSLLSTFDTTLQSKTKWWFNRLGKEFAPEPGQEPVGQGQAEGVEGEVGAGPSPVDGGFGAGAGLAVQEELV
ncbi:hypothetical protein JCM8547_006395 [Rhodosporidiobolus lusitaniae]